MAIKSTGLTEAGIRNEFFARLAEYPSYYEKLAIRVASTLPSEKYRWLGSTPKMREWRYGRLIQDIRSEKYEIENGKYESTIEVDREEIEDDQTGQIRQRINEMAEKAATFKDYLIAQLLLDGETSGVCYDGHPFISDAHESGESGVQSNKLTYNAADADKPSVLEFKAALQEAIAAIMGFKDDQGDPVTYSVNGLFVIVPPTMFFTAREAISAATIGATTNVVQNIAETICYPWLSDQSKWYLAHTGGAQRPIIYQDRIPLEFTALENNSENAFKRDAFLYGTRARFKMGYGNWQKLVRMDFN